jgi:hypothetical protein
MTEPTTDDRQTSRTVTRLRRVVRAHGGGPALAFGRVGLNRNATFAGWSHRRVIPDHSKPGSPNPAGCGMDGERVRVGDVCS